VHAALVRHALVVQIVEHVVQLAYSHIRTIQHNPLFEDVLEETGPCRIAYRERITT